MHLLYNVYEAKSHQSFACKEKVFVWFVGWFTHLKTLFFFFFYRKWSHYHGWPALYKIQKD
jgi:hypothetical protein